MKKIVGLLIIFVIFALSLITYQFLWGKLFPFSPIFPGFSKHEFANTVIYVQNGAKFNDYANIDALIPAVENFHELKFTNKPKIFIFRDKTSYLQRSLSNARFCAFPSGSLVISPWALQEAKEGKISLDIYLRHELSHVLIFQHKGFLGSFYYPKWLLEGIAVYSTNQMGTSFYPSKKETYRLIKEGNFLPPQDFKTKKEDQVKLKVKFRLTFMYSEFGCIVDYLIKTEGKAKFLTYMKGLLKNNNHNQVFKEVYGLDFDQFLEYFKAFVEK